MKICRYCGTRNEEQNKFCISCGAPLTQAAGSDGGPKGDHSGNTGAGSRGGRPEEEIIYTDAAPRSIVLCIILTVVTCGIYSFYWTYKLNNEINDLARDPDAPGGGLVIIFWLITLGIYGLYWYYKMGQKCDYIRQTNSSSGILYLILGAIGLGIVANALIQDTINRVLE